MLAQPKTDPDRASPVRALIFHSFDHVRAALAAARDLNQPVLLLTAPGAAAAVGPDVLKLMVDDAAAAVAGARFGALIDCGSQPGVAMGALRAGWRHLVFQGDAGVQPKIADLARQHGAVVDTARPPARDFGDTRDPDKAAMAWLRP
jgi:hypothetical protein